MSQNSQSSNRNPIATARRLAQMDPQDDAVNRTVEELESQISLLTKEVDKPAGAKGSFGENSRQDDVEFLGQQIDKLRSAAMVPAKNYQKIISILSSLKDLHVASLRPQNAVIRPRLASILQQIAGVFSECDTSEDLDKPLSEIEKGVHSLYSNGKLNDPNTYNFRARSKGHHGDPSSKITGE